MVYTPTPQGGNNSSTRSETVRGATDRQSVNNSRAAQGATNQAVSVNYYVRLVSGRPVRQAFMRVITLAQKTPDRDLLKGLQSFVDRDFSDYIVVAVSFDSTDGRFSGPVLQSFAAANLGTLKNRTYLERKDGKRLFLMDYQAPINDGLGAKFIFPRMGYEGFPGPVLQSFAAANLGTLKNRTYLERKDGKRLFLMDYQAPINDGLGAKFIFPRMVDERNFLTADSGSFRFVSEVGNQIKLNVTFKMSDLMYNGQLEY